MLQRQPVEILHHQKPLSLVVGDLMNSADVGMIQSGGGARLPSKPLQGLRVLRHIVGQKLERNEAAEHRVLSLINDAHSAAAQLLDDVVVRNGLVDHFCVTSYVGAGDASIKARESKKPARFFAGEGARATLIPLL